MFGTPGKGGVGVVPVGAAGLGVADMRTNQKLVALKCDVYDLFMASLK